MMSLISKENSIFRCKTDNRGVSLVELIICVAILAIATAPLFKAISMSTNNNARAQKLQNATSLAERIMEDAKGRSIDSLMEECNGRDPAGNIIEKSMADDIENVFFDGAATARTRAEKASTESGGTKAFLSSRTKMTIPAAPSSTDTETYVPFYVMYLPNQVATQGETYNATVTFRTSSYHQKKSDTDLGVLSYVDDSTTMSATSDGYNVAGANYVKLPQIDEIDTLSQTVLTDKELAKYDAAALDYFSQRRKNYDDTDDATKAATKATIVGKTIKIKKEDAGGTLDSIKVECSVVYEDELGNKYTKDLYVGTYSQQYNETTSTYDPLNSNIYIFYKRTQTAENVVITDESTIGTHYVYFVMQDDDSGNRITDISGTTISINNSAGNVIEFDSGKYDNLDINGNIKAGTSPEYRLITNLGNDSYTAGHIYDVGSKIRVIDVTVELTKAGDDKVYATLTSTKNVNISVP